MLWLSEIIFLYLLLSSVLERLQCNPCLYLCTVTLSDSLLRWHLDGIFGIFSGLTNPFCNPDCRTSYSDGYSGRTTFIKLIGTNHLELGFERDVRSLHLGPP